jgi:hypothetical protein
MTRLAYLIMAHEHPPQLLRLVNALDCERAIFCIHIDRKVDARPFQNAIGDRRNVHFVQDRVNANWMGFSLVEATLRLLALAVREGFDYCVLLSGADYPIKSNEALLSFYSRAQGEYIAFWRLEDRPSWMHKVRYHYFIDAIPIRGWSTGTEKAYWRRLFWGRFFRVQKYIPQRRFPPGMVPFGGPDWWSLSIECARYVLRFVEENPRFKRFYKTTASPGEMFFQTIILNSRFAQRVQNCDAYSRWREQRAAAADSQAYPMLSDESFNFRYTDWSGELTGARETPAILDERDWEKLVASPSHFARKFDPRRSATLLDRIDGQILNRQAAANPLL